jgi:uncharacterized protein YjbI with pentapeptide repeats
MSNIKTIEQLIEAYKNGERYFYGLEFENSERFDGLDFSGSIFENCYFGVYFKNTNLCNSKFINSNIKTSDFSKANLTNAYMTGCNMEATRFKDAIITNFIFENNLFMGNVVGIEFIYDAIKYENEFE